MKVKTISKVVLTEEEKSNLEKTAKIVKEIRDTIDLMPGLSYQEAMSSIIYCDTIKQNISKLLDCTNVLSNKVEEEINWSKVPINTPILVRNDEKNEWKIRNFAGYIDNKVCAYNIRFYKGMPLNCACGRSSWKYAKLKTTEEKPEVDWSKVPIDTPVLVRETEDCHWIRRYFAGYIGGRVCVFADSQTSKSYFGITPWKYAKLETTEE